MTRFYAYDSPALDRAADHGCLDEDVETGDPTVCATCSQPHCRVCHRPIDTDHEPIEAGRCQDCHNDHQRDFAEWLAGGWSE